MFEQDKILLHKRGYNYTPVCACKCIHVVAELITRALLRLERTMNLLCH